MGLGSFIIDRFGMRKRYMGLFERLINIGAAGLGHGQPFMSKAVEEHAIREVVREAGSRPVTIFDIGANRGEYTEVVLRNTRPGSRKVHAFEPDEQVAAELRQRFIGEEGFTAVCTAMSDHRGTARFYKQARDRVSTLHDATNRPQTHGPMVVKEVVEVPLETVDDYCAQHNIERIDLLKIDTEGHDLSVLKGARRMMDQGRIANIQFEFSEMNLSIGVTFMQHWELLSPNYDLFRMCNDGLYPIPKYNALQLELYYVVNFFAKSRSGRS